MNNPDALLADLEISKGKLRNKIATPEHLFLCDHYSVLPSTRVGVRLLTLEGAPQVKLIGEKRSAQYGYVGEFLSMRNDIRSCLAMQRFLRSELPRLPEFAQYSVCDVGFWDLDVATDSGFSWHNDDNWTSFLRPDHETYQGWFVYSATPDCNTTLAISCDAKYNECNKNVLLGICDITDNEIIRPDVVVPLHANSLALFPVGSLHRTYRFREPESLTGHRTCVSFVLYHKGDRLNDHKLERCTDDELCEAFSRYPIEKAFDTGHFMVPLLEEHPRTRRLLNRLSLP